MTLSYCQTPQHLNHSARLQVLKAADGEIEYQPRTLQKARRTMLKRLLGQSLMRIKVKVP